MMTNVFIPSQRSLLLLDDLFLNQPAGGANPVSCLDYQCNLAEPYVPDRAAAVITQLTWAQRWSGRGLPLMAAR